MKRIISLVLVAVLMVLALASCSNITASYADKINAAAEADEHYTYEQVVKALGGEDAIIDLTAELLGYRVGGIIAVEGSNDQEALEEKLDAGEKIPGIIVTIADGKATMAVYRELSKSDFSLF